eukprot:753136-Hanusia_phi.AAC.2
MLGDALSPGEGELILQELLVGSGKSSLGGIEVLAAFLKNLVVLGLTSSDLLHELRAAVRGQPRPECRNPVPGGWPRTP